MSIAISLDASANISLLGNGNTYQFPSLAFTTHNVFAKVAFMNSLIIKFPTQAWREDFEKYAIHEIRDKVNPCVRAPEAIETLRGVPEIIGIFPEFQSLSQNEPKATHFLMVHKFQYHRLQKANLIKIPESRFILLKYRRLYLFDAITPAIVQERVRGVSFLEMFDEGYRQVKPEWRKYLPTISPIIQSLINSELRDHLNWFIKNFIFNPETGEIYYVDSKPSFLFARAGNEGNIEGLQTYFI